MQQFETQARPAHRLCQVLVIVDFAPVERIDHRIDAEPRRVAQIARPHQRQHDIWAFADAPYRKRLAEILRVLLDTEISSRIENTEHAHRGIHKKSVKCLCGTFRLALHHIIGENDRRIEIAEHIRYAVARNLRGCSDIDIRHRADHRLVSSLVEGENLAVERLERVIDLAATLACAGTTGGGTRNDQACNYRAH